MAKPRRLIVNPDLTCYYHVMSRCVRSAMLLLRDSPARQQWLCQRLQLLAEVFAIEIGGYAVMGNHFHLVVRLEPEAAEGWSDEQVVRRWARIHPPRDGRWRPREITEPWVQQQAADRKRVARLREKLKSLSQFMKDLKQPLAELANREDKVTGHFWEGRFKSHGILDEAALLAVCTYVDLNPFRAGLCPKPEDGQYVSLAERIEAVRQQQQQAGDDGTVEPDAGAPVSNGTWLLPIGREKQEQTGSSETEAGRRRPMFRSMGLRDYLQIVDQMARLWRAGKQALAEGLGPILDRLGLTEGRDKLTELMDRLRSGETRLGYAIAVQ